jgi:hypothetical protein
MTIQEICILALVAWVFGFANTVATLGVPPPQFGRRWAWAIIVFITWPKVLWDWYFPSSR